MKGLYQKNITLGIAGGILIILGYTGGYAGYAYYHRPANIQIAQQETQVDREPRFVASIKGSTYYLTACRTANRILEKNRRYFSSREEAEQIGLRPAKTCPEILLFPQP